MKKSKTIIIIIFITKDQLLNKDLMADLFFQLEVEIFHIVSDGIRTLVRDIGNFLQGYSGEKQINALVSLIHALIFDILHGLQNFLDPDIRILQRYIVLALYGPSPFFFSGEEFDKQLGISFFIGKF